MNDADYETRAVMHREELNVARLAHDAELYSRFAENMRHSGKLMVDSANEARELGLSFSGYYLPTGGESARAYYAEHYQSTLGFRFDVFKWLIAISKRLPEPCREPKDMVGVLQLSLWASELTELPHREEAQCATRITPFVRCFNSIRGAEEVIEKMIADAKEWNYETRSNIVKELERHRAWAEQTRRALEKDLYIAV